MSDHVDGNALAGDLREIFAVDLTVATGQCAGCGYRGSVATLRVYQNAPGIVARCPHCEETINTIRIVGLSRSQVAFTSTLPRKGRVAVCPECDAILPVELSGLL